MSKKDISILFLIQTLMETVIIRGRLSFHQLELVLLLPYSKIPQNQNWKINIKWFLQWMDFN